MAAPDPCFAGAQSRAYASARRLAPCKVFEEMTVSVATLDFPRIGLRRELKFALESYWAGKSTLAELQTAASGLRVANWARQKALGADILPSNDFSLYDHVLDTSALIGAIPPRYDWSGDTVDPDLYFAMARGGQGAAARKGQRRAAKQHGAPLQEGDRGAHVQIYGRAAERLRGGADFAPADALRARRPRRAPA